MEEAIRLPDSGTTLALFGPRDRYLRRIREAFPVSIVARNGILRISGDSEPVTRCAELFTALAETVDRLGALTDDLVAEAIAAATEPTDTRTGSIDILSKKTSIKPRSPGQKAFVEAVRAHDLVICAGPAGSGKTYLAVALAVNALKHERVRKIVLARPAVEAGERLGFLPGDMLAKVNPYLRPLYDALHDMMDYTQIRRYMDDDMIEVIPLAFMRGRTLNDSFIILDEAQNCTVIQMKMFLTRFGNGSKVIVNGDDSQIDLPEKETSGLIHVQEVLKGVPGVAMVRLSHVDIVRHPLVQRIVNAYDRSAKGLPVAEDRAPGES